MTQIQILHSYSPSHYSDVQYLHRAPHIGVSNQRVKDLCGQCISSLQRRRNEPDTNTDKNATCSALRKPFTFSNP